MRKMALALLVAVIASLLAGCGSTELAQSPYSEVEKEWGEYIKRSYPSWTPPRTYPPASAAENPAPAGGTLPSSGDKILLVEEDDDLLFSPDATEFSTTGTALQNGPPITVEPFPSTPAVEGNAQFYTVQKGDTLWKIASKSYGNGAKWKTIYEANKDVLPSPEKLKAGMELVIPPQ